MLRLTPPPSSARAWAPAARRLYTARWLQAGMSSSRPAICKLIRSTCMRTFSCQSMPMYCRMPRRQFPNAHMCTVPFAIQACESACLLGYKFHVSTFCYYANKRPRAATLYTLGNMQHRSRVMSHACVTRPRLLLIMSVCLPSSWFVFSDEELGLAPPRKSRLGADACSAELAEGCSWSVAMMWTADYLVATWTHITIGQGCSAT